MNRIAELNDAFRKSFWGGKVILGVGVGALSKSLKTIALDSVREFDKFTSENDPNGEHNFGSFDLDGKRFNFKIDYYAPDMQRGSEDPADPEKTVRVLTIMLEADY